MRNLLFAAVAALVLASSGVAMAASFGHDGAAQTSGQLNDFGSGTGNN